MHEEELTNAPLDATFGEGPQTELGDITDIIKDSSIVDLSWLSEPTTFLFNESIVPAHKDLEHNWGDTTDSLFGAFKLVKGNPSVREQIKKKSLWDHSAEMANNLYHWAPPSVSRVASKGKSVSSLQLFQRLMHRGYTGDNLLIEAKKYMPEDEFQKSAHVRDALSGQQGLLGNVYVDVTSFESCFKAKEVTDKYNKLAKFVLKTPSCVGCSHNVAGRCSLVSKKIASKEQIFTENVARQYFDYLTSVKRVDEEFLSKHASLDVQGQLQKAFLARKSVSKKVGGVKASLPVEQVKSEFNQEGYTKVAAKYLAKGYDLQYLKGKFAAKVPNQSLDFIFEKAASSLEALPTNVARCDSDLLKSASRLQRSSKCGGCSYDMSSHCAINKVAFNEPKSVKQREIKAAKGTLPMYQASSEDLVSKTAKALEKGHTYSQVLKAASKITGTNEASKILDQALVRTASASPEQFKTCDEPGFKLVSMVKEGSRCNGCTHNRTVGCGYLKKAFVQEAAFDENSVQDHKVYSSFFKDLSFDSMVSVNEAKKTETLDIEGLNQFNL